MDSPTQRLLPISYAPVVEDPGIVLQWLVRLRWLALIGQLAAAFVAVSALKIPLPLAALTTIIAITGFTNLFLQLWTSSLWQKSPEPMNPVIASGPMHRDEAALTEIRASFDNERPDSMTQASTARLLPQAARRRVPGWIIPAVLMLDVFLLTALLLCAGGKSNPFCMLYLVHVTMAVVTLAERWSWLVVAATIACYGLLFALPGTAGPALSPIAQDAAQWIALALVAGVIAYFVGRMTRSLRLHENMLTEERERGSRNERLASLTTLAAGAAHELNTPLGTIALVARELELQSAELPRGQALADDARLIRREIGRCQVILSRMRVDVLQSDAPKPAPMPAAEFVRLISEEARAVAGDSIRIETDPNLPPISLPLRPIEQAVGILIDNAIEASPDDKPVTLSIHAQNGHIIFEVRDEGSGMTPDVARRAGEPFFTTKPTGEGMGMGLFLVRLVAEKLGGSLRLESQPNQGTRAILELPT